MHQALYRKWRPDVFDDVYGQEHITNVLRYEAQNGKFNHAYLFCGSRGTGKTTCAKILAKVVNCESPVDGNPCGKCASCVAIDSGSTTDVIEMDAASNNGVDNIRDIKDAVTFAPATLKYRVYIIDEVHMLSNSAFNALLKTIEEPPSYVIFILATTELHKLPATIVSRCQRFDFRRIATEKLCQRLRIIADNEGIEADDMALTLIARNAQGGMRDAISLLELCSGTHERITSETVNDIIGSGGKEQAMAVIKAVSQKDYDSIFSAVDEIVASSKDISVFWQELMSAYRDMFVARTSPGTAAKYLDLTEDETSSLKSVASAFTRETMLYHTSLLDSAFASMQKPGASKRIVAEMTLIKMCDDALNDSNAALLSRISKLEAAMTTASFNAPQPETEKADTKPKTATKAAEPIPEPSKVTAPSASALPKTEQGAKRILKKLKAWPEVLENIASRSGMLAGIIKPGKAYVENTSDGDRFIVRLTDNGFTQMMMEKFKAKSEIRSAMCIVLCRDVTDDALVIEYCKPDAPTTDSAFEELIED